MDNAGRDDSFTAGRMSRRDFIVSVLLGLLAVDTAWADDRPANATWMRRLAGEPKATRILGAAYLDTHPGERDAAYLSELLEQALFLHAGNLSSHDADTLATAAVAMIGREYAQARVVDVDGWILSVSEARLYALQALMGDNPG